MTKQTVKNGKLMTTTEREIHTRRAVIIERGNNLFTLWMYSDEHLYMEMDWPPKAPAGGYPDGWQCLARLRDYVESVQFGGRVNIGWRKEGDEWLSDSLLGDSGGNGFTPEELDLIRKSRREVKR